MLDLWIGIDRSCRLVPAIDERANRVDRAHPGPAQTVRSLAPRSAGHQATGAAPTATSLHRVSRPLCVGGHRRGDRRAEPLAPALGRLHDLGPRAPRWCRAGASAGLCGPSSGAGDARAGHPGRPHAAAGSPQNPTDPTRGVEPPVCAPRPGSLPPVPPNGPSSPPPGDRPLRTHPTAASPPPSRIERLPSSATAPPSDALSLSILRRRLELRLDQPGGLGGDRDHLRVMAWIGESDRVSGP